MAQPRRVSTRFDIKPTNASLITAGATSTQTSDSLNEAITTDAPPEKPRMTFFSLPRELRDKIYDAYIKNCVVFYHRSKPVVRPSYAIRRAITTLSLTNAAMGIEATRHLYANYTIACRRKADQNWVLALTKKFPKLKVTMLCDTDWPAISAKIRPKIIQQGVDGRYEIRGHNIGRVEATFEQFDPTSIRRTVVVVGSHHDVTLLGARLTSIKRSGKSWSLRPI